MRFGRRERACARSSKLQTQTSRGHIACVCWSSSTAGALAVCNSVAWDAIRRSTAQQRSVSARCASYAARHPVKLSGTISRYARGAHKSLCDSGTYRFNYRLVRKTALPQLTAELSAPPVFLQT